MNGTGNAAYETSKAALLGLARSIAVGYGPRGIRANAVCPGWVETPSGDRSMEDLMSDRGISLRQAYRLVTQHIPLRRPATADEVAACILFLASDESSIVTGTTLVADGGGLAVDLTRSRTGRITSELASWCSAEFQPDFSLTRSADQISERPMIAKRSSGAAAGGPRARVLAT